MSNSLIENLLARKIGLETSSVGSATIDSAIRTRMEACGLVEVEEYHRMLLSSPRELEELIDQVTVPETWFFRDEGAFRYLRKHLADERLSAQDKPLRILSVPCSTGEEPYSIAMTLREAGFAPDNFHIDAVDINHRSLARAKEAVFGNNSFRGEDSDGCRRYFHRLPGERYRLRSGLASSISFFHGNLATGGFLANQPVYDIVFCRNLLIYMEENARDEVLRNLKRLVRDKGLLFVGHVELLPVVEKRFRPLRVAGAFVYMADAGQAPRLRTGSQTNAFARATTPRRKDRVGKRDHKPPRPGSTTPGGAKEASRRTRGTIPPQEAGGGPNPPPDLAHKDDSLLKKAEALADQGRLVEAKDLCQEHLRAQPLSSQGLFLLGVIAKAQGDLADAENFFSKAIFLDADHKEALSLLAYILENRGEGEAAEKLRRRGLRNRKQS